MYKKLSRNRESLADTRYLLGTARVPLDLRCPYSYNRPGMSRSCVVNCAAIEIQPSCKDPDIDILTCRIGHFVIGELKRGSK